MKKTATALLKVLIWLGFFINLGLIDSIQKMYAKDTSDLLVMHGIIGKKIPHSTEEEREFSCRMYQFVEKKIAAAKIKIREIGVYTVSDYFRDYRQILDSMKVFGQFMFVNNMTQLQAYSFESHPTSADIQEARGIYIPEILAEENEARKNLPSISDIGDWFLRLYLKTLPLAFFLFVLWLYEAGGNKSVRIRNPISFSISLALYPLVIGFNVIKWWMNARRRIGAEIEIRRSKDKIFQLLSQDEIALIKKFIKSRKSLKEFRFELSSRGYISRHSIVPILFAMLFFALVPPKRFCFSSMGYTQHIKYEISSSEYFFSSGHSPDAFMHSQFDLLHQSTVFTYEYPLLIEPILKKKQVGYLFVAALCRGHWRGIDHVPLHIEDIFSRKIFQ